MSYENVNEVAAHVRSRLLSYFENATHILVAIDKNSERL